MDKIPPKILGPLLIILGILPLLIYAVKIRQLFLPRATYTGIPARVEISPGNVPTAGGIITPSGSKTPVYLSATAVDTGGTYLNSGVTYVWGISSTNSIGDLIVKDNTAIATFIPNPANPGYGDLWVKAITSSGQATSSVKICAGVSCPAESVPTPSPSPSPSTSPTPTPVTSPSPSPTPITSAHPVTWSTATVSLTADDFYIQVNGKKFVAAADPNTTIDVHSDPGDPTYTTLEITWREQGVEMRFFAYFHSDANRWWPFEIRTYDGNPNGQWIYYQAPTIESALGQPYEYWASNGRFNIYSQLPDQGLISFSQLHLQAFLNRTPTSPISCVAEIYKATSSNTPPYPIITANLLTPGSNPQAKLGDYFLYLLKLDNNTATPMTNISVTTQNILDDKEPIQIINSSPNCAINATLKTLSCPTVVDQGPNSTVSPKAGMLVKVIQPKISQPYLSTNFAVHSSLGNVECATNLALPVRFSGDFNTNGHIDIFDYNTLIANFGRTNNPADINGDGKVDIFDYNILVANFGS